MALTRVTSTVLNDSTGSTLANNSVLERHLSVEVTSLLTSQTYIGTVSSNVDALSTAVDTVTDNVNTVQDNLNFSFENLTSNINTVQSNIDGAFAGTELLLGYVDTNANNILYLTINLHANINSVSSNVDLVRSNLDSFGTYANSTFATISNLNLVQDNVATNATNINTVQDNVATNATNINTVQDNVATNATNINTVQDNVSGLVTGLEGANTNIATNIANINTVQDNVSAAEANILLVRDNVDSLGSYSNTTFGTITSINTVQSNLTSLISGPTTFTADKTFTQDVVISGNLTVVGNTTQSTVTQSTINGAFIVLGANADLNSAPITDSGLFINRGNEGNLFIGGTLTEHGIGFFKTFSPDSNTVLAVDHYLDIHANAFHATEDADLTRVHFGLADAEDTGIIVDDVNGAINFISDGIYRANISYTGDFETTNSIFTPSLFVNNTNIFDYINTVQNNVATNISNINIVQDNVAGIVTGLEGANTNINTVQDNVAGIITGLEGANTNINTVQDNVDSIVTGLEGANTNINTVQDNVATNIVSINTVQDNVTAQETRRDANTFYTIADANVSVNGYDVLPTISANNNLGSLDKRWSSLFLSGSTLYLGDISLSVSTDGTGISIGNINDDEKIVLSTASGITFFDASNTEIATNSGYGNVTANINTVQDNIKFSFTNVNTSTGTSNVFFAGKDFVTLSNVVLVSIDGVVQSPSNDFIVNTGNSTVQFTDSTIPSGLTITTQVLHTA